MKTKEKAAIKSSTYYTLSAVLLIFISIMVLIYINKSGFYPWGENTYRYLYTQEISKAFSIVVILSYLVGGFGFILWGKYFNRPKLCLFFACLWFFIPNNLKVLFSDGNIPIVLINSLIPYIILQYYKVSRNGKLANYIKLAFLSGVITILNSSISIMLLLLIYFMYLVKAILRRVDKRGFFILGILTISFLAIRITLLEKINNTIFPKTITNLLYPLGDSLNPILRLENNQVFYIGIVFFIVAILGILFCDNKYKEKTVFWLGFLMIIGTSSFFTIFYEKIPFNEFLTLSRITSLALGLILFGIVKWINLNRGILIIIGLSLVLDSTLSFKLLAFNTELPKELMAKLDIASEVTVNNIGILDISSYGSFPSYYLKYFNGISEEKQLFNFNWGNEINKTKLIGINSALEQNYFLTMFDRCLDLGVDTLLVNKSFISNLETIEVNAEKVGYKKIYEDNQDYIFNYPTGGKLPSVATYKGIAIGKYSTNIIYNFPNFTVGESNYIDDYTLEELQNYESILLSGFIYRDKGRAESMLTELSSKGIRVVIDTVGMGEDDFLGIKIQEIELGSNYGEVYYKGEEIIFENFPKDISRFKCNYIENISSSDDTYVLDKTTILNYLHYKNENLIILAMNIPYFLFETKDSNALNIMQDVLNIKANELPVRK